ncbi:hypothetical protein AeRB84_010549 [Aphanomyces euteiches]|nr:hypothetical protein AeRB84_010549 [Aphanomyces euteiches]
MAMSNAIHTLARAASHWEVGRHASRSVTITFGPSNLSYATTRRRSGLHTTTQPRGVVSHTIQRRPRLQVDAVSVILTLLQPHYRPQTSPSQLYKPPKSSCKIQPNSSIILPSNPSPRNYISTRESPSNSPVAITGVLCASLAILILALAVMLRNKFTKRPTRRATVNVNLGTLSAYRLDSVELVLTKCVVKSDFMSVYMGMLDKQVVAVKQLQSGDIAILELFVKEITLQSSLKGPRVVDYLGACWNDPFDMKCVMEYMDCGDLKSILASHKSSAFPWDHKLKCVQEIVHGLKYIHQLPRVHGALRSKNVLLDTSKGAKLTNFYVLGAPLAARAYQWAAPEVLSSNRFSASADIYSLGVILWELESHKVPFADLKNDRTGK